MAFFRQQAIKQLEKDFKKEEDDKFAKMALYTVSDDFVEMVNSLYGF